MHASIPAALAALLLTAAPLRAQDDIVWSQVLDIPKGANLPADARVDILGIRPGDSCDEARAALERLIAEPGEYYDAPRIQEYHYELFAPRPNGQRVKISYVGMMKAEFSRRGTDAWNSESVFVGLSAPSSGHQVVAIERTLSYNAQADQPRISAILAGLSERMGGVHRTQGYGSGANHYFRFDDGGAVGPDAPWPAWGCNPVRANSNVAERDVPNINHDGSCDVVFEAKFNYGISDDHAQSIWFTLGDNERARQNFTADYQFFRDYVSGLQDSAGGEPPKL